MNHSTEEEKPARKWGSMWLRLREEMYNLVDKNVAQIPPCVVLGYMDYIMQLEEK